MANRISILLVILTLCLSLEISAQTPVMRFTPSRFGSPYIWLKQSERLDTSIVLENVGTDTLSVYAVPLIEVSHDNAVIVDDICPFDIPPGIDSSVAVPISFNTNPELFNTPFILTGTLLIYSNCSDSPFVYVPFKVVVIDTVPMPEYAEIRTNCTRFIFGNNGNIGRNNNLGNGGYNFNFFDDCDTTENFVGYDDNSSVYLADASPVVMWIDGPDTIVDYSMFDNYLNFETCFHPLTGPMVDSTTFEDYAYGYSGKYLTHDTSLELFNEYYAPKTSDSCNYVIGRTSVRNVSGHDISDIFLGEIMDWSVPSDIKDYNYSNYNDSLQSIWCGGWESEPDSLTNNDCVLGDHRIGGYGFYGGLKYRDDYISDYYYAPKAMWTENNSDWIDPTGEFIGRDLWKKAINTDGYETWEATADFTNPDSIVQDLHTVIVYENVNMYNIDSLSFIKIYAVEYDGGEAGFAETITKARQWMRNHAGLFPELPDIIPQVCCQWYDSMMGDLNSSHNVNILDIVYLIEFLYQGGPELYCPPSADINCDCAVNILDITCYISHLYSDQSSCPICTCDEWKFNCAEF